MNLLAPRYEKYFACVEAEGYVRLSTYADLSRSLAISRLSFPSSTVAAKRSVEVAAMVQHHP